tara:strand:- start:2833 stop:3264 length:432 start_codon:yes stop_codon:yes gene_type:complete
MKKYLFLFVLATVNISCTGVSNNHPVPITQVNENLYLNTPSAYPLQFVGGSIFVPEWGYRGIAIYRRTNFGDANDFGVYDLCCPNHTQENCGRLVLKDNLYAQCPCDEQEFLLFDGQAIDDPVRWGLLPYRVGYDGASLHISN